MLTKCPNPNCNSTIFEMVLGAPQGSNFKVWFVQCAVCGTAVNAMEYLSLGTKMDGVEKKILDLESSLLSIQQNLQSIDLKIRQLEDKLK